MRPTDAFAQVFRQAQELGEGVVYRHKHLSWCTWVTETHMLVTRVKSLHTLMLRLRPPPCVSVDAESGDCRPASSLCPLSLSQSSQFSVDALHLRPAR
jgi:hypothetical protein